LAKQKEHFWCLLQLMSKESEQAKSSKENGAGRQEIGNGTLELDLNKDESMK
jgi:hypothetical protein